MGRTSSGKPGKIGTAFIGDLFWPQIIVLIILSMISALKGWLTTFFSDIPVLSLLQLLATSVKSVGISAGQVRGAKIARVPLNQSRMND